ncbi:type IV pilus biogenesis protein PilM [Acetoanaerobium noterae]|uniref:type IV pilus biogenesis protein PilM n=1 Tax=Acetoanaerobium noterae TaxID=745369 RepID=UPI0028AB468A|nr:pilus assembly protein PilM [Acetoanaerobium noterae]
MKQNKSKLGLSSKKKDVKCLSIDIGSSYIKFAVGQKMGRRLKVDKTFKARLPAGVYENGHMHNIQEMKSIIQGALNANSVKLKDVICTLESTDAIKRELVVPAVAPEDLSEMVSYEIGQYLPIDINSYVLQYKIVREFEEENVKKYELLVAALPKEIVHNIYSMLIEMGLDPYALDIHSNAVDKIAAEYELFNEASIKENTVAFLDLGHENINVIIVEKGQYKFNRLIKNGTRDFEQLTTEFEFKTIDEISQHLDVVDRWIEEIDKVFKYYTSRSVDNTIDKIFIYGGISVMEGLDTYIHERVNIPVELIKSIDNVEIVAGNEYTLAQSLNAISAIIRL